MPTAGGPGTPRPLPTLRIALAATAHPCELPERTQVRKIDLSKPATLSLRPDWEQQRLQQADTIAFETAAEAIRFAVESHDAYRMKGALLTVGAETITMAEMRAIYSKPDFPGRTGDSRRK